MKYNKEMGEGYPISGLEAGSTVEQQLSIFNETANILFKLVRTETICL